MSGFFSSGIVNATAIPDAGIARYRFEQNLSDAWNNNDLTGNGDITFEQGGQEGDYYALLDTDDYETAPFQFDSSQDFSFVGWVYFVSFSGDAQIIVAQRDSFSTMDWQLWIDTTNTGADGWAFGFGESLSSLYNNNNEAVSMPDTGTGEWAHVGLTKGGDTWTFYLDAVQEAQITDSTSWTTSETLYLGGQGSFETNIRQDLWDFYSKELTATEVSNHHSTGSIGG